MSLTDETKKAMNYKEITPTCKTCRFMKEVECTHTDRMWYETCTYSELCNFRVASAPNSSCEKHEFHQRPDMAPKPPVKPMG